MTRLTTGYTIHPGRATGPVLRLDLPLSFWGGTDHDGRIIDRHHPQCGDSVVGRVLVMESGRGSSSSSYVLVEAIRSGHAPAAIVLAEADAIIALGAIVAEELYGIGLPIALVDRTLLSQWAKGEVVLVNAREDEARIVVETA